MSPVGSLLAVSPLTNAATVTISRGQQTEEKHHKELPGQGTAGAKDTTLCGCCPGGLLQRSSVWWGDADPQGAAVLHLDPSKEVSLNVLILKLGVPVFSYGCSVVKCSLACLEP